MEPLALADTNVVSYLFRGDTRGSLYGPILERFDHVAISFQTLAELQFWMIKHRWEPRRRTSLANYLKRFGVVLCDERICTRWAEVKAARERAGRPIHPEDAWIAATALELDCPLVTHNATDFQRIDRLRVLTSSAPGGS